MNPVNDVCLILCLKDLEVKLLLTVLPLWALELPFAQKNI